MARQDKRIIKQVFSFYAPEARSVLVVGDFTDWEQKPIALQKGKGGIWEVTVPLRAGTYQYRYLVDGEWRDDPGCAQQAPNPFGGTNAVLVAGGSAPDKRTSRSRGSTP